jgi:hypothetical protein
MPITTSGRKNIDTAENYDSRENSKMMPNIEERARICLNNVQIRSD